MYSAATLDYALRLGHAGALPAGAPSGDAGSVECGDAVRIAVELTGGRIQRARFRAFGCPHAVAAAELACERLEGRGILDAARLGADELERGLDPGPRGRPCVALAADALHGALASALATTKLPPTPGRVVVAMSGGVDSAVALLHAVRAGLEPVGVTLRLWVDPQAPDGERACCSPTSVRAARAACHALGVPHLGLDLREAFREAVVEPFVREYAAGRTPNPCVRCNASFRFDALAAAADALGAPTIATGHYARVERRAGRALLLRGCDPLKDQSYMLARLPAELLERLWLPLGGQTKEETRAQARAAGLAAAGRRESQEVCFVGGGDYRTFLERQGVAPQGGQVVDAEGHVLGRHAGVHRFTPGQRRGVGVAAGEPLYVLRTEPDAARVVVGPRRRLETRSVRVVPGDLFAPARRVRAKLRYRSAPVWAGVVEEEGGFRLELEEPVLGAAPGQAAVLYDGDAVVGAGLIA